MSEADLNTVIGKLTIKLIWRLVIPVLVIVIAGIIAGRLIDIRIENKRAEGYYIELYRLTAELSTTQAMYMKANDEDKVRIGHRIDYLIERMDKYTFNDTKRGDSTAEVSKKYGLDFTPLMQ